MTSSKGARSESLDWARWQRDALERRLRPSIEGEARFDAGARALYSTDASHYRIEPLGVAFPRTEADLATIMAIAAEQGTPIIPRGAGTSLSGQAIGPGLVVDCSRHLHRILEINAEERWARVQPGVVLAQLNATLAPLGLQFGPDVATSERANLGGMIGNNSAGARSLVYGKTVDHVRALDVALTDGQTTRLEAIASDDFDRFARRNDRESEIYRTVRAVVWRNVDEIRKRYPRVLRRVSGYNLDALAPPAPFNLAKLIVGSEGTLAMVMGATLQLLPLPKTRALAVVHYDSLDAALVDVRTILATKPSAIELIDRMIIDLARASPEYRSRVDFVVGRPEAILLVEYSSDDPAQVEAGIDALRSAAAGASTIVEAREPARRDHIWSVRKTAMPLLMSAPGARKPVTFVEDTAVAPERLPEFVTRFREILSPRDAVGSFYGHASVGCLHIRPMLNLRSEVGVRDMAAIADEVVALVREFGGALSGEHGDGLCRSIYNRQLFGDQLYECFRAVKRAFDPKGIMNPGKIVDGPPLTDSLRESGPPAREPLTVLSFERDGGVAEMVARCNGNGLCRRERTGTMCPSFVATRDEEQSPRGRANLLRAALEGRLSETGGHSWANARLADSLDLCLMCKACQRECPTRVDIAKIKMEYLHESYKRRSPPIAARMTAAFPTLAPWGSRWAPFSNWILRAWPTRWLLDAFAGVDRRRKLPAFRRRTLVDWFRRHRPANRPTRGRVALLADCFTNYHQPEVGQAAVTLLEQAGYQVHLADVCCGRTMFSKGFLNDAKRMVAQSSRRLLPYAEEGYPILGVEPSCILTLTYEWLDLLPGEATRRIASRVAMVESWLDDRRAEGACDLVAPPADRPTALVHGHCHQRAAGAFAKATAALAQLAGVQPQILDTTCCGMAGSFGYEKPHYDVSVAVAEARLLPLLRQSPDALVVASGFSCRSQIADLADRRALHPLELIQRRLAEAVAPPPAPEKSRFLRRRREKS